jgi:polyketide biosynthesis enoyl-CoA hydratase PksH
MLRPLVIPVPERLDPSSVATMLAQVTQMKEGSAVILEGAPNRFCLGMTFVGASVSGFDRSNALRRALESFASLLERLLNSPRPTLAVVDGPALGGGLGLAAACDFVLATARARFGLPEALYGLAPAIIRPALLTRLSIQKLNMLLFTCHSRSAEEALSLGLVDRIVALEDVEIAKKEITRHFRRVRSETVIGARRRNSAAVAEALHAGVAETAAALADERVIAALTAAASDEDTPWNNNC